MDLIDTARLQENPSWNKQRVCFVCLAVNSSLDWVLFSDIRNVQSSSKVEWRRIETPLISTGRWVGGGGIPKMEILQRMRRGWDIGSWSWSWNWSSSSIFRCAAKFNADPTSLTTSFQIKITSHQHCSARSSLMMTRVRTATSL